ncbi:MAG: phage protein [Paraclostridium sp.]
MSEKMYKQIREVEIIHTSSTSGDTVEDSGYKITYDELDINFDIRFTNDKKSNICYIDLYNISDRTLANIKSDASIRVRAGYEEFNGYIFTGKINYCSTTKSGEDIMTRLTCTPDAKSWNTQFINKSWNKGSKAQDIAEQIINMAGWSIGDVDVGSLQYNGGKIFRKTAKSCLEEIANDANLTLYFNNGLVYMYPKNKVFKKKITISPNNGLIDSPIKNIKEKKNEVSYKIKTALRYDYQEDTILVVEGSKFIEPVELKIISGVHKASDGDFYSELECRKITDLNSISEEYDDADLNTEDTESYDE